MSAVKAVIFDLGETLLNFGRVNHFALIKEANRRSYNYLKKLNQPVGSFLWYGIHNFFSIWGRYFVSEITGKDFNSLAVMRAFGRKHKFSLTSQQWQQLSWLWYEPLAVDARAEGEIVRTLGELKEMGLKLMIVSNTFVHSSTLIKHLEQLGMWRFFDDAIFSYEFNFRKPDKRILLAAAQRMETAPENILLVGDRLNTDIKGALNCGMMAVLKKAYTNEGKMIPQGVKKISFLSELSEIIKNYNKQFCRKEVCNV